MGNKAVIVEPEIPENTGFIARLAANFDYDLRIVNPQFNLSEARGTASSAQQKLRDAVIFEDVEKAVDDLDFVVGTKPGRGRPVEQVETPANVSVMIGRESSGLSSDELELCDSIVYISTSDYESINQSHAAAILLHSFNDADREEDTVSEGQKQALRDRLPESVVDAVLDSYPSRDRINLILGDLS